MDQIKVETRCSKRLEGEEQQAKNLSNLSTVLQHLGKKNRVLEIRCISPQLSTGMVRLQSLER